MPNPLICPACGKRYDVPAEYLRDNAGLETDCTCGHSIPIPAAPPQLSYAAPEFPPKPVRGVWADGCHVVVARGTRMPNRCCICNEPVAGEVRPRTMHWVPPEARPAGGLLRVFFSSAIADSYSQSIVVRVARCPRHRFEFKPKLTGWILAGFAVAGLIGTGVFARSQQTSMAGLLVSCICGVAGTISMMLSPRIKVVNFRGNYAWIEGFGDPYLIDLPLFAEEIQQNLEREANAIEQMQPDDE